MNSCVDSHDDSLFSESKKRKKRQFESEHSTIKHPTGIPLTFSGVPKVEAGWGYGGTGYHHAVPQWGPNIARSQRARER